jgi:aerobic carbon-monoxide dehydrogenase small subunit
MTQTEISLMLNGNTVTQSAESRTHLADFIREDFLLTGTHLGCEQGVCGACTIFVDGRPTRSCITLAASCESADVRTVESFDDDPLMACIRDAFTRHHGLQCGYCTPGMLATAYDIARRLPNADTDRIRRELAGNLCRCTGYAGIVAAIEDVLANDPPKALLRPMPRSRPDGTGSGIEAERPAVVAGGGQAAPAMDSALPDPASLEDAVRLTQTVTFGISAAEAWPILSDPSQIVPCVPGANLTGPVDGPTLTGQCVVAVGPIKAIFKGVGSVTFDHDAKTGALLGAGRDTVSRTALEARLEFALHETGPTSCRLDLYMRYRLAGPLSQFGRPELVAEIAKRLLQEVAVAMERRASGEDEGGSAPAPASLNGLSLLALSLKAMIARVFGRG